MLTLPSGERIWLSLFAINRVTATLPIKQYQMVQKTTDGLELRLAVRRPLTEQEEAEFRGVVLDTIGTPMQLELTYQDEIPRDRSGKYEMFKSEITKR